MTIWNKLMTIPTAAFCAALAAPVFAAESHIEPMTKFADEVARKIVVDPDPIRAVIDQNIKHAHLTQEKIDSLDKQWRAETKASKRPLIDEKLGTELSKTLLGIRNEARGLITEIFVTDNKGLNVGQSDVTSDYWQGDEDKWQKTYLQGPASIFIDEIELDESTQTFQSQLSLPIVNPTDGSVIGAITIGVNVDELL